MHHERELDALLSPSEAGSIVDRLMAMPQAGDDTREANEWDRAVASRLQTHLVKQMRSLIDHDSGRDRAA